METYCETRKRKDLEGKDGSFKEEKIYKQAYDDFPLWISELKREELEVSKLDGGARER